MTTPFTIACILFALFTLFKLAWIDLKTLLLPNKYVAMFFISGVLFHFATNFYFSTPPELILGTIFGGGLLLMVRIIANRHYGQDTLGLGDVKLMAAAGTWLGFSDIFIAISLGALAGVIHGILYQYHLQRVSGHKTPFSELFIPAGPGFIIGIIFVGTLKFHSIFYAFPL